MRNWNRLQAEAAAIFLLAASAAGRSLAGALPFASGMARVFAGELAALALSMGMLALCGYRRYPYLRVGAARLADAFPIGVGALLLLSVSALCAMLWSPAASDEPVLSMLLFGVLLIPVAEECLFRGLFLTLLAPVNPFFAVALQSVWFAMCHTGWSGRLYAGAAGTVFGALCVRTGSIFGGLALHMGCNALAALNTVLLRNGLRAAADVVFAVCWLGALAGVLAHIYHYYKRKKKHENQ